MALSIEQKATLLVGGGFWQSAAVGDIPSISITDGPHGVRRLPGGGNHIGIGESIPATCFPPAAGIASSWNTGLVERVGEALGREAGAQDVAVLLGPGVNIKRSPLCGRNFEYFSEDPLLSGELGAAWVHGLQSQGVGASVKHFAANNQETDRMTVSVEVDERTLREIYLPAFEKIVTREQPWTVMCSYNRINGTAAAESKWLLTEILRDEWGFDGAVISDWGAVDSRLAALEAGVDLEMPGPQRDSVEAIVAAVASGALAEEALDAAVERVRRLVAKASPPGEAFNPGEHHALAREAAAESVVLLRNEGQLLPLATGQNIGIIGEFARTPRYQGAGSSQVLPTRLDSALDAISAIAPVEFAAGYGLERDADAAALRSQAVEVARRSDTVLVLVGLPPEDESEGYDRTSIDLPSEHVELIRAVAAANPRTVVVLSNGGVVSLEPWHDEVPAILESWLLGQAGGSAIADILFGLVSPSGRLAESIPYRLQDNPTFLNFPGENDTVRYGEGVFVGYRYYERAGVPVRYPFGYGLGYSSFEYTDLVVSRDGSAASVTVTNTGGRSAKEVVQLYVAAPPGPVATAKRELRAFDKVSLGAGESARVEFALPRRAYSYFDVATGSWRIAGGEYLVQICRSAHEVVLSAPVRLPLPKPDKLSLESPVSDFISHPVTGPLLARAIADNGGGESEGGTSVLDMVGSMPMRRLLRFPGIDASPGQIRWLMAIANNPVVRTVAKWVATLRGPR